MSLLSDAAARGRRRGLRLRLVMASLAAVAALAYLIASGVRDAAVYSLSIAELQEMGPAAVAKGARVSGMLEGDSMSWDAEALQLAFRIREGERALPVVYKGTMPEMFRDGAQVIVEGHLGADGTFQATVLQLRCPSKYESGTPVQGSQS